MYGGRHKPKESYFALGNYGIESAWFIGWRDTDIQIRPTKTADSIVPY